MYVLLFLAAGALASLSAALLDNSAAVNLIYAAWMLAPYLVLTIVMVAERRTSLMATAVTTLLGAVGALPPAVMVSLLEESWHTRFLPLYQAGVIAVLLPTAKWLLARIDVRPPGR